MIAILVLAWFVSGMVGCYTLQHIHENHGGSKASPRDFYLVSAGFFVAVIALIVVIGTAFESKESSDERD